MHTKTVLYVSIAFGFVLVIFWGSTLLDQPYKYHGSLIEPPIMAADFELTDQEGETFRFEDQRGKLALIFFGYTHCPDICPSTLVEFQNIYRELKDLADKVDFIFITVDPERDTQGRLKEYFSYFNPDFIALTSDREKLTQVWKNYGVYQQKQESGSATGYLVDHSTRMYLVDATGNLVITYPYGFESFKISEDILFMLEQGGQP
jgi:protein SCO1